MFGLGASWGGYESLIIPFDCTKYRTATRWAPGGPTIRLSIGLEDLDDLKEDFEGGLAAFSAARLGLIARERKERVGVGLRRKFA